MTFRSFLCHSNYNLLTSLLYSFKRHNRHMTFCKFDIVLCVFVVYYRYTIIMIHVIVVWIGIWIITKLCCSCYVYYRCIYCLLFSYFSFMYVIGSEKGSLASNRKTILLHKWTLVILRVYYNISLESMICKCIRHIKSIPMNVTFANATSVLHLCIIFTCSYK